MPELPTTLLQWLDLLLLVGGGLLLLTAVALWRARGNGDPLRHSPLRPNYMNGLQVWLCLLAYAGGASMGAGFADSVAPEGLTEAGQRAWRGLMGSNMAQIVVIIACLAVARLTFLRGWLTFGFGRHPFRKEMVYGLAGWLIALFLAGLTALLTTLVIRWLWPGFEPPEHAVFQAMEDPAAAVWMRLLAFTGAFLLAPIGEELLFRGIIQTGIRKLLPPRGRSLYHRWVAISITALLFGGMHFSTPHHVPALVVLGLLLGFLYERRGSLTVPIIVHMLFNGRTLVFYELQRWIGGGT
jgi:membrane protease YdiL (CAAX protease family)